MMILPVGNKMANARRKLSRWHQSNRWLVTILFLFIVSGSAFAETDTVTKPYSLTTSFHNEHILFGYPSTDCQILNRTGYVACYDTKTKVADWTSYHLTDQYLQVNVKRTNDFRPDPDVPAGRRSELRDYSGSGYDRGHLVPAADMRRSVRTMSESFILTNMAPQTPRLNRGIWNNLEGKVRALTLKKRNAYIMTGPLYLDANGNKTSTVSTLGEDQVAIPTHFYKIIIDGDPSTPEELETVAFIIPNVVNPPDDLSKYVTSIAEVERLSGLNFLNKLDAATQNRLEAKKNGDVFSGMNGANK